MVKQRLESSDYGGWGDYWAVAGVCGVGGTEFGGVVVVSAGCTNGGADDGVLSAVEFGRDEGAVVAAGDVDDDGEASASDCLVGVYVDWGEYSRGLFPLTTDVFHGIYYAVHGLFATEVDDGGIEGDKVLH